MTLVAMALRYERGPAPNYTLTCSGVVAVCDTLLSNSSSSVTLPYGKFSLLGSSYLMGYAGDPSLVYLVGQKLRALMDGAPVESLAGPELGEKLKQAYSLVRHGQIEDTILGRLGMTFETFFAEGLSALGKEKFHALCEQVEDYRMNLSLLVAGYGGERNYWNIFRVDDPGVYRDQIMQGFDAIGSGAEIALSHLHACHRQFSTSIEWTAARLLEAKFMAEAQRNVGSDTHLQKLTAPDGLETIRPDAVKRYREKWDLQRQLIPDEWLTFLELNTTPLVDPSGSESS